VRLSESQRTGPPPAAFSRWSLSRRAFPVATSTIHSPISASSVTVTASFELSGDQMTSPIRPPSGRPTTGVSLRSSSLFNVSADSE
jgi:hypothetical protein